MSASFYDLLKYAATGIASPSMTYYDRMRASTLMGATVRTLTRQPPLTFKADGTPLISWSMLGNGSQQGTPTPDNPVMPTFCGVRTGNLCPDTPYKTGYSINANGVETNSQQFSIYCIPAEPETEYALSLKESIGGTTVRVHAYKNGEWQAQLKTSPIQDLPLKFTTITNCDELRLSIVTIAVPMINLGSTSLPYEPYGWAAKITCAGQTVPVYLGQVQTVRRIKKLVLDGTETLHYNASNNAGYIAINDGMQETISPYCDMLQGTTLPASDAPNNSVKQLKVNSLTGFVCGLLVKSSEFNGLTSFRQWLADNTPTVWYVLATPETATVNEPLCKIGNYADELSSEDAAVTIPTTKGQNTLTVDTPIQPSEMTITYKG